VVHSALCRMQLTMYCVVCYVACTICAAGYSFVELFNGAHSAPSRGGIESEIGFHLRHNPCCVWVFVNVFRGGAAQAGIVVQLVLFAGFVGCRRRRSSSLVVVEYVVYTALYIGYGEHPNGMRAAVSRYPIGYRCEVWLSVWLSYIGS
jgi:hypothetical protein